MGFAREDWAGKPVIGITCEVVKLKPYFAEFELVCDYRYIRAVLRAGGTPVLLPLNPIPRDIGKLVELIDGLVIIGGAMIVVVNLLVDILYALIDPRIRLES